ncbi:hypothetical protein BC659_0277 [Sediminibacterium goheungense]|uniref:Uncharacterized protein n=2 Tax=Sediminibacterium goheungense TaxID=1086393 RepID=A0A4R6J224_9BACT|nr:hypothetical protein BC659_0277 [Sediminibacterium goheungense]
MKSNVMPSIVQLEAEELKELVREVKETVAVDVINTKNKETSSTPFGAIDLWKIRRTVRTARASFHWEY